MLEGRVVGVLEVRVVGVLKVGRGGGREGGISGGGGVRGRVRPPPPGAETHSHTDITTSQEISNNH